VTKRARRAGIRGERVVAHDYTPVVVPKNDKSYEVIVKAVTTNFLFRACGATEVQMIADAMTEVQVTAGYTVMKQGDQGDFFYVIEQGQFDIIAGGRVVDVAKPGECIGELALMFGHPRTATIIAQGDGLLWRLGRNDFRAVMSRASEDKTANLLKFLKNVPLLQELRDYQRMRVAEALQARSYSDGEQIQRSGEAGTLLHIITKGKVRLTAASKVQRKEHGDKSIPDVMSPSVVRMLQEGDFFGERSLLLDEPLEHSAVAVGAVEAYTMDRMSFNQLMGPLRELLSRTEDLRLLETIPILQNLTEKERDAIVAAMTYETYLDGDYIIRQGEKGDAFYIVKSSSVVVSRNVVNADGPAESFVIRRSVGEYFGEMSLIDDERRAANVVAVGTVSVARLMREDFERLLGPLRLILERETQERRERIRKGKAKKIMLADLTIRQILGTGAFGKVKLAEYEGTMYALKSLKKSEVVKLSQQEHVKNELEIMTMVQHPLIMSLVASFKDEVYVYMLMELIQGGELFRRISSLDDALPNDEARFYTANVISCLEYLADLDIVYRDLKPENLLIDADGYLKMCDFGCAKVVTGRTFTLCGSPEYVAPEVLLGKGYNRGVDVWSLGVLVYEMAVGFSPFNPSQNLGHLQVCSNIIQGNFTFPKFVNNRPLQDFIKGLLSVDPTRRLGMMAGGWSDIKLHKWFEGFDWEAHDNKTMLPPWKPPLKDANDCSMFDPIEEEPEEDSGSYQDDCPGWDADF